MQTKGHEQQMSQWLAEEEEQKWEKEEEEEEEEGGGGDGDGDGEEDSLLGGESRVSNKMNPSLGQ